MSDVIQLLPDSVANQIAAGEVIQRPASVIKELVENAVDAGATHIDVSVVDAGRTSIQVIDDGKGMSETDARLAFERHATSKIRKPDDLFNLHTMGFRGEALPSIAAVAQVEVKTRQTNDEIGTDLTITGSKVVSQEPCACPVGCNFMVENLFFNVPARRKFLKSNTTELNNIIAAFERIVLVYPKIAFSFHSNGSEIYGLRPTVLRQRIIDIFGKRINSDLLPVKVETSVCGINGFVGKPESAKKKGAKQYFFVNGRYMRHPYFHKAVQTAFERLVPQGEQVPYFLYFDVDPKNIDVNIHPTKTEIKFDNDQTIFQLLLAAVRDAIGAFNDVSTLDFDTEGKPDIPVFDSRHDVEVPKVSFDPQYNPFKPSSVKTSGGSVSNTAKVPDQWEQLYEGLGKGRPQQQSSIFAGPVEDNESELAEEKSPVHYQYKGRYIMTAVKSGLMIIDQHRAHVRILYEQYLKRLENHKIHSQKMLFPLTVELSAQEIVVLSSIKADLTAAGFEVSSLGGNSWSVLAIPEGFEGIDVPTMFHDILSDAGDNAASTGDHVRERLAASMAKAAAIPYGQVLSNEEMEDIVNSLFQCSNVNYTPSGKNVLCILKQHDIEQMLG